MKMIHKIYDKAPVWIQNVMCSAQGFVIHNRRFNKNFFCELRLFEQGRYYQAIELIKMLQAIRNMPVYASYLENIDFEQLSKQPKDVYSVIHKFPIIDKTTVRRNIQKFTNPNYKGKSFLMHTSGTTGSGLIFPYSVQMENKQWAVW